MSENEAKIRRVIDELGVKQLDYELQWIGRQPAWPHGPEWCWRFRQTGRQTLYGSSTRAIIRAIRRRFARTVPSA